MSATTPSSEGKITKVPAPPLPATLIQSLPTAAAIIQHVVAIERLRPQLEKELKQATKRGAIDLARCFIVFHRMMSVMGDKLKSLNALFEEYKVLRMPAAFEAAGVTHVPLDAGYRVGVNYTWRASIKGDMREKAYDYLRKNYADCVIETVNSSTLSALARELQEEKNIELPSSMFNVAHVPSTSVTRTG
jgi:hypothetical protein